MQRAIHCRIADKFIRKRYGLIKKMIKPNPAKKGLKLSDNNLKTTIKKNILVIAMST